MGLELDTEERWVEVASHPNYQVSDRGRIRNSTGSVLSTRRTGKVYPSIRLYRAGIISEKPVHVLVMAAFGPPRPPGEQIIRHWDDNPDNNHVSNLLWGTHSDNMRDSVRNGTHNYASRTHCPKGHPLEGFNLLPSKKRGHRQCYACHLGQRRRANPGNEDLIYRDLSRGWRPSKGPKQIVPGTFGADKTPDH